MRKNSDIQKGDDISVEGKVVKVRDDEIILLTGNNNFLHIKEEDIKTHRPNGRRQ